MKHYLSIIIVSAMIFSSSSAMSKSSFSDDQMKSDLRSFGVEVNGMPEVRVPKESWDVVKKKMTDQSWALWVSNKKRDVDQWMALNNEDHLQSVGWAQDYIDPKTGKFIYWSHSSPPPLGATNKVMAAWRMHVRVYNLETMLDAIRLYKINGDVRYKSWVVEQMNLYAQAYSSLPLQTWNGRSQMFNQALDEAVYSFDLLETVRLLRGDVTSDQLNAWKIKLFSPMAENLMQSSKIDNNISVWIAASVAAIGKEFNISSLVSFGVDSDRGLNGLLERNVSKDYYWNEMSLQYQDYVVSALSNWLYVFFVRGDNSNTVQHIGLLAKNMMLSQLSIRFSNLDAPMLNDSQGEKKIPNTKLWSDVWRVLPTVVGISAITDIKNWDTLIDDYPEITNGYTLPSVVSRQIAGIDSAQLVSQDWQALIQYGEKSAGHAHQESMTYELQHNGTWVFRDPGTVGYGSPLHKNYFRRVQAHTGALINRDGQLPWPSEGQMDGIDTDNSKVVVRHLNFQRSNDITREIQVKNKSFIEITHFSIGQGSKMPAGVVYNTACSIKPSSGLKSTQLDTFGSDGPFSYWTNRVAYIAESSVILELNCLGESYSMVIKGPDINKLYLAQTPSARKNEMLNGIYVETGLVESSSITTTILAK